MHEMSIAMSIVDAVEERARQERAEIITAVELDVGKLSGVEVDSLRFCFSAAVKNSMLEEATLAIRVIQPEGKCSDCGRRFPVDFHYATCVSCGSFRVDLIAGRELTIRSITLE
ncbi:hydrogenase maturation nickel metallochaperone HypA [Prosthecochloris sp. GSB1]|uniref:hydrogenase maturation nickel metallochaperone HypA n=1 Tax=Prosthecochloris sp. GSB1 TaxID=281093 RepID=UPI000B8C9A92|nr:hydrogenase maturation nickel metallochaperone HypA [Prosthecochloris sp. GSB1]ASQ90866.1 hydrogenase maturation nickel metallochaperone HypA [Prosthecochloris sp. GSB1]